MRKVENIYIEEATEDDIASMLAIDTFDEEILNNGTELDALDEENKEPKHFYEMFCNDNNKWCYVAKTLDEIIPSKKNIVGFILFTIRRRESFWKIKKIGYITLLFVEKSMRKNNIGTLLLKKAEEIFREKKLPIISLSTQASNTKAHSFWNKNNYITYREERYKKI